MTSVPRVQGKFFELDGRRFLVKGVAYGTFAPDANGLQFPSDDRVDSDFAMMAAAGLNTVRTYTVPPLSLLDAAARHGLRVIAGIPWSQHIAFLDDPALTREVRRTVVEAAGRVAAHPATLMVAVGNEIPPAVVRWHGHVRVERFLRALYDDVKSVAPDTLVTYVNFPPTEHLDVSHFDVCAFNVYLHRDADLRAYLVRLQHLAGNKPLLLAEAGADSIREGLEGQARITAMHLRTAFAEGAAGAVAFSWTDEWWRGGHIVEDWAFGLVDAARQPKPALAAVAQAFAAAPFSADERAAWPTVSVVICAYNAADTIRDCLTSLQVLTYPRAEVIVVDDGSRDDTASIAASFSGVRLISIPNGGLSAARNVGLAHATGEIVAYTDADVRVDPDWLTYLVQPFVTSDVAAAGGPNVVPADDPWVAQCVARAPGGPTQVLLDDRVAEHVPGCNLAVSRDALLSIGGFNPVYLRAGDDVDVCWRLQAKGYSIGFAPSALVWHHHRGSVKAYWRQQAGYGEGETWLDAHHPEKFVRGQMLWRGRIYSPLPFVRALAGRRVNTGVWGTAAFPSVYSTDVPAACTRVDVDGDGAPAEWGTRPAGAPRRRQHPATGRRVRRVGRHGGAVHDVCGGVRPVGLARHRWTLGRSQPTAVSQPDCVAALDAAGGALVRARAGAALAARCRDLHPRDDGAVGGALAFNVEYRCGRAPAGGRHGRVVILERGLDVAELAADGAGGNVARVTARPACRHR